MRRGDGVFDEDFAGYLTGCIRAAQDTGQRWGLQNVLCSFPKTTMSGSVHILGSEPVVYKCACTLCREVLAKVQAKLSNPLLRQAAPFEY